MLEIIRELPKACEDGLKKKITLPKSYREVDKVIVAGIGGSAIAGDIISDCFHDELKIPVTVSRSYELPAYVDERTLMICVSYSGNTRETLEQLRAGMRRGCKLVGISSGGKLVKVFEKRKLPLLRVRAGIVPRAALGYLLSSIINVLRALGLIKIDKIKIAGNPEESAKIIAKKIKGTLPIIYCIYPSVARRFKTQLNENSKMLARWEAIPEAAHNEIEAFGGLDKRFSLIFLRDRVLERKEIKKSIEFFKRNAGEARLVEIFAKGKSRLERILYLIWFTDFVSYFLAVENKVNPEETQKIKELKEFVYGK